MDGTHSGKGRVRVYRNGVAGNVYDDYFDVNDAKVICRMIGIEYVQSLFMPLCAHLVVHSTCHYISFYDKYIV